MYLTQKQLTPAMPLHFASLGYQKELVKMDSWDLTVLQDLQDVMVVMVSLNTPAQQEGLGLRSHQV